MEETAMRNHLKTICLLVLLATIACQSAAVTPRSQPQATRAPAGTADDPGRTAEPGTTAVSAATPVAPTPVPDDNPLSWIFDIPANPLSIDVVLDTDSTVEALIPVEGGTLSATGADGAVYNLEIPPGALLKATTIGLTPVSSLSGLPFGGERTYAVQFSPDGLFLYTDATLTITPPEAIALDEQIVFGYEAEGQDPILAAPVVASTEIKILVQHFSGNGVTKGLLADLEPARERVGGSAERRLENALNAELIRQRQGGGEAQDLAAIADILSQYEAQVVEPRVAAAGESCAAGQVAIESVLRLARMRALLGLDGGEGGDPLAKYPGLLEKAAQVCVVEESELCVEQHIIHRMLPVWKGFERQFALLGQGDSAVLREARDLTVKCLTFDLKFESTATLNIEGGGGYESTVHSDITLRFNPDEGINGIISGEAPLDNDHFEWFWPCGVTSVTGGGGPFKVFNLEILEAPVDPLDPLGQVSDFVAIYMPGNTSESATADICESSGATMAIPPGPWWTGAFNIAHLDDLKAGLSESDAGYATTDWEIFGDEYFAKKEWIKEASDVVEAGTFKLYHTPGR